MTLIEQIRSKQIEARKSKEVLASLFTTLLGEASIIGKNAGNRESTDDEVIAVIKKFIKNIDETLNVIDPASEAFANLKEEKEALEKFLPKQLDADTLRMITRNCHDLPDFMRYLKLEYAGRYDGKLASAIAKEMYA